MLINAYFRKIFAGISQTGIFNLLVRGSGDGNGGFDLGSELAAVGVAPVVDLSNALTDESGVLLTNEYGQVLIADT